jgi:acetyltransferase-like isoleucine patch superfamily enzyme
VRIDPRAVVEDDADIGERTSIWHFAHVRGGSTIGNDCIVGKGAYVDVGVSIGDGCKLQNGAMVYNGVSMGDGVFVGPHAVFTNDLRPRANIWDEEKLCRTEVQDGASIGANATIRCGITIGRWCMIAAGSVVTKDVPAHALMVGVPAKQVGWVTKSGERMDLSVEEGIAGGSFRHSPTGETVEL